MRFGRTLRNSIYQPWASNYIDYAKLKRLLREDDPTEEDGRGWTEDDEGKFVEELVNVQLEKVNAFQAETYKGLRERTSDCEARLEKEAGSKTEGTGTSGPTGDQGEKQAEKEVEKQAEKEVEKQAEKQNEKSHEDGKLQEVLKELDGITTEINELEKYSRINYTGFLKAVKKHDRRRGSKYRVRPLVQVRLAALPFNSEDYSPLLYRYVPQSSLTPQFIRIEAHVGTRVSTMYSFIRQRLNGGSERTKSLTESKNGKATYTSHKCKWIARSSVQ